MRTRLRKGERFAVPLLKWTLIGVIAVALLWTTTSLSQAQLVLECPDLISELEAPTAQYYVGIGNAYFTQIDYTNAIAAYTCALDINANYAPALVRRGYAYTVQGDEDRALADYNRALELDPNLIDAYNNRGVLYMTQGNFGLAIGDFSVVIAINPEDPVAYNNRGIAYAAEGSFNLAIEDLEFALELDPEYAAPHASLGAAYTALAVQSYNEYRFISGQGEFVLPRRQPVDIIRAVDEDGVIREFEVWIPFLTPSTD
ncbi:MAG: tetratricopeptide repeat protein [Chloroflexota bacterium]